MARLQGTPRTVFFASALALLLIVAAYFSYLFMSRYPGANDFYPRWAGGCGLLRDGLNPYSEAATLRIQESIYGRPAQPDEDQVAFAYPLYSLLFIFPLCIIEGYAVVQTMWFWVLLIALVSSAILCMRIFGWHPKPWLSALTILWVVLLYYSFRALILGQFAIVVLLALVASVWAMKQQYDGWAGILLALATVKPQMIYLAIPWILLWAAGQRRWRLWTGFLVAMAALTLGGMLLLPSWLPDFVRQVLAYPSYTVFGSLTWMIVRYGLGLGRTAEIITLVALGLLVVVLGWRLWRGSWERMLWMLGLLLLLTNFFTPRIATTNYILSIPWMLWGFRQMKFSWPRWGTIGVVVTQAVLLGAPWAIFLSTVQGDFEQPAVYFSFPVATAILLLWLWIQIKPTAQSAVR